MASLKIAASFVLILSFHLIDSQGTSEPICLQEADVVFVVDDSGTDLYAFDRIKAFIVAAVGHFSDEGSTGFQFGVVQFSDAQNTKNVIKLNAFGHDKKLDLISAIEGMTHVGGVRDVVAGLTAVKGAMSSDNGLRDEVLQIVVFLITGDAKDPDEDAVSNLASQVARDFNVIAIGIGEKVTMPFLTMLSGGNPDDAFISKHAKDLEKVAEPFYIGFCQCEEGMKMNPEGKCFRPQEGPVCSRMADIVFVFDASGSVGEENYVKMKKFMSKIVNSFATIGPDGVQVAAVRYANWRHTGAFVNLKDYADKKALTDALMAIPYVKMGSTMTAWALRYTRENVLTAAQGLRADVPHIVIVITDGQAKDHKFLPKEVDAIDKVVDEMLSIGIGSTINQEELDVIAGNDPEKVFLCKDFDQLLGVLSPLLTKVCECPKGHGLVDGKCSKCDEGSMVKEGVCTRLTTPATGCNERIDLMFVLDASGSIGDQTFEKVKNYAIDVIETLGEINEGNNQVGVVKFADLNNTREAIKLNQFHDSAELVNALAKLPYVPLGASFLGHGLRIARLHGFDPEHGARLGVPAAIVVISDAKAKDVPILNTELPLINAAGFKVYAVGLGNQLLPDEMLRIASGDKSHVFNASGAAALADSLKKLGKKACGQPLR